MRRVGQIISIVTYYLCLAVVSTALTFAVVILAWEILRLSRATGIDDDITFLALPPGFALGLVIARATRRWTVLHWLFVLAGVLLPPVALSQSQRLAEQSGVLREVMGPLVGFADAIGSIAVAAGALFGGLLVTAGIAGLVWNLLEGESTYDTR
jgi:hypothetical protein